MNKQKTGTELLLVLVFIALASLTGCASTDSSLEQAEAVEIEADVVAEEAVDDEVDPYENFNRKVFVFNDKLDQWVAKPVSDAYLWVTPQFVQTGIANFFNNLDDINVVLNDMLQGKLGQGAEDTGRFAVNSTLGLLGLFDVATELGLEKHDEDFDQTLAVWGVPQGPYLVLPILGPSTTRGITGTVVDTAANPVTYVGWPVQTIALLNARANAEGSLKFIDEAALDPYVFTRESFLQYRNNLITDGASEISDDLLDLEDEFYEDEEDGGTALDVKAVTKEQEVNVEGETVVKSEQEIDETHGFKLELSADENHPEFSKASGSFDQAYRSFEEASRAYQQVSEKLDRLQDRH